MRPNPNDKFPNPNLPIICYIKNAVDNPIEANFPLIDAGDI